MVRLLGVLMLVWVSIGTLAAQVRVKPEGRISALYGLSRVPGGDPLAAALLAADLGLSAASPDVRSQVMVRLLASEPLQASLVRAWVRARLGESGRFTAGISRLSWGQGFFFNSGDVLYGSTGLSSDLTAESLREEAGLLLSYYQGLGDISFFEILVFPPSLSFGINGLEPGEWETAAAGGRVVVTLPEESTGLRMEAGYLFRGGTANPALLQPDGHVPYAALQGSLWGHANLYASARLEVEPSAMSWEGVGESLNISGGLYRLWSLEGGGSVTVRLEGLVEPGLDPIPFSSYTEMTASPDGKGTFLLRGITHSDASALIMAGWLQRMYQGLTVQLFLQVQAGEDGDIFGWNREGDLSAILGMEYKF